MNEDLQRPIGEDPEADLTAWARVYLHGFLALVVLVVVAYVVTRLVPLFEFTGSPVAAVALSILTILIVPPLVGSIIVYGVLPMIGKKAGWSGITRWDRRLFGELERAKERARVVVVDWPGDGVRTIGVLTSTFRDPAGERDLGAVYVPTAPRTSYGYVRVVPIDELEFTDWTLAQWRAYQLSFGSVSPPVLGAAKSGGDAAS